MSVEYKDIINECSKYFKDDKDFHICRQEISTHITQQLNLLKNSDLPKDKKKVVFYFNDSYESLDLNDEFIVMHLAIVKSTKKSNHFSMPFIIDPILSNFEPIDILPKKPTIGFCGHFKSHHERYLDLSILSKNQNILDCDFILRERFWAGKPHDKTVVQDFENNMISNIFNVCTRGNGNFSIRFFQTLSAGRIPILTDTDIELPFSDVIDYSKFCIIGNRHELIPKILDKWNLETIQKMQKLAFDTYKHYISLPSFPKRLKEFLNRKYNVI